MQLLETVCSKAGFRKEGLGAIGIMHVVAVFCKVGGVPQKKV